MKRNERQAATMIDVFQGRDGAWYFHAIARNREKGTLSEGYRRKSSAVRGAVRWHPGVPIRFLDTIPRSVRKAAAK